MKKILILLVLSIAIFTSVYAQDFNLSAGVGYTHKSFAMKEGSDGFNAFQAQIGLDYMFDNNSFIYGDFSMAFPSKIFAKNDGEKQTMTKNQISNAVINELKTSYGMDFAVGKVSLLGYGFSVGYGYYLKPVQNLTIKLGGGLRYDAGIIKLKDIAPKTASSGLINEKIIESTIGLGLQIETDYFISDNIGVMLSLKPNVGFHTFMKVKADGSAGTVNMGATQDKDYSKCSFTFNATAGMIFAF